MGSEAQTADHLGALADAGIGLWSWEVGGAIRWTDEVCTLFGVPEAPPDYDAFMALIHEEDRDELEQAVTVALEHATQLGEPRTFSVEHRTRFPADGPRWVECRGIATPGEPPGLSGLILDINRRKVAQIQLRESEERYRLYAELASDYAYQVDLRNPSLAPSIVAGAFESTVGYTPEQVAEKGGWQQVIHPEDRPDAESLLSVLLEGRPAVAEYRIVHGDGRIRWLRDRIRPLLEDGAVVELQGAVVDVTDAKRMERQLVDSNKDEALARFAGNAAHDFNNLLTVILGSLELVDHQALKPLDQELLEAALAATTHAGQLTHGMLLFGRRVAGEPRTVRIGDLIRQVEPILRQAVGKLHQLELQQADVLGWVRLDPGQAQLMLLNLVLNARHAMTTPGAVGLQVEDVDLWGDSPERPAEIRAGRYARIAVRDEGVGIAQDALPHVFEPFFTTREPGEGTGLGLSAARGIAQAAGGTIVARNRPSGGAEFHVYLPFVRATPQPAVSRQTMTVDVGGNERVLVVDDDAMVLRIFVRVLRDLGYSVDQACDGEEALLILEQQTFDLVLSDIVMPGMGGVRLAREIEARWPGLPILLTSGNIDGRHAGYPFLATPVAPQGLGRRVREVLDASARGTSPL